VALNKCQHSEVMANESKRNVLSFTLKHISSSRGGAIDEYHICSKMLKVMFSSVGNSHMNYFSSRFQMISGHQQARSDL